MALLKTLIKVAILIAAFQALVWTIFVPEFLQVLEYRNEFKAEGDKLGYTIATGVLAGIFACYVAIIRVFTD